MRNLIDKVWPTDGSIRSLLDVGCGDLWFSHDLPGVVQHTGVDAHQPSLDKAHAKYADDPRPHRFNSYCMDLREYLKTSPANYYDCVMAIDVIEHFEENEARFLITEIERVAGKLAIIWTTLGWIEQGPYDNNGEFNELQRHHSAPQSDWFSNDWKVETYPEWHGDRGGAIFAYKWIKQDRETDLRKIMG